MARNKNRCERLLCPNSVIRCSAVHSCIQERSVADVTFEGHFENVVKSINYVSALFQIPSLYTIKAFIWPLVRATPPPEVLHKI